MKEVKYSVVDTDKLVAAMREQISEDEFDSWLDLTFSDDKEYNALALAFLNSYTESNLSKEDLLWWMYFR